MDNFDDPKAERFRQAPAHYPGIRSQGSHMVGLRVSTQMLRKVVTNSSGVRRPGAAALDLCYVAAGRLDAFWETGLAPWDLAAGSLMIREAGGIISGLDGSEDYLDTGHVLAGTPKIYAALAQSCAQEIKGIMHADDFT